MCGICGIVNIVPGTPPDTSLLLRMMGRLHHRGPDGSGYYRDQIAALGHTRLSIVDLSGGAQPLSNEDGSIWITFNGEIFNYVELAHELTSRGHIFQTKSDTEVIIHSYEEWNTACFERFNGQWAFALWDNHKKRLLLSRDRMGIRPLYYTFCEGRLLFASEIKAIFAENAVDRKLDPFGLAQIFTFWCPVAPNTTFSSIRELRPGHYAELNGSELSSKPYWQMSFLIPGNEPSQSETKNAEFLCRHLVEATRLRFLRSDVPVGAYLSGGLDSSVTSAIVARYTDVPLHTFSIRFEDDEYDEGIYQKQMALMLETEHNEIIITANDIANAFPDVIWHTECPILRAAPAPLFLLSRLVRESGYKVVVTGEGADEVLAGYDIFREAQARLFLARDPTSSKRHGILMRLYPWLKRSPTQTPAFAKAFFLQYSDPLDMAFSHRPRWNATSSIISLLDQNLRNYVENSSPSENLLSRVPTHFTSWHPLARAQWLEVTTLLSGYILSSQGDRMLMAHSVEGRFPFLDCNLVDFANHLPPRHKLHGIEEKHLLKVACGDLVAPSILKRPKQPYRAPDAASFFAAHSPEWINELTSESYLKRTKLFNPAAVSSLVTKCRKASGRGMSNIDNMRIVAVLSTLILHMQYVESDGGCNSRSSPPIPMKVIDTTVDCS